MRYLIIVLFCISSCKIIDYAKAVNDDSAKNWQENKRYFYDMSFNGEVTKKYVAKGSGKYRYRIVVESIQLIRPKESNARLYCQDLFSIRENTIDMSVSRHFFDGIKVSDLMSKESCSDSVSINDSGRVLILNKEPTKWIP